jgi:hypothetical protein
MTEARIMIRHHDRAPYVRRSLEAAAARLLAQRMARAAGVRTSSFTRTTRSIGIRVKSARARGIAGSRRVTRTRARRIEAHLPF